LVLNSIVPRLSLIGLQARRAAWSSAASAVSSSVRPIRAAAASGTRIAVGATASIYLSYVLGNMAVLRARTKGWPKTKAPFKLGGWGIVVNIIAVLWGLAMMVNFLTPSSSVSAWDPGGASAANYLRIFSNPKPVQSDYYVEGQQLLNFHIKFLNDIPVIWTVFAVIFIAGALYYWIAQKKKPWEPVLPPEEDLSGIVAGA